MVDGIMDSLAEDVEVVPVSLADEKHRWLANGDG